MESPSKTRQLLRLISYSLGYLFILCCLFFLCQYFYQALRISLWPLAPDLSLQFLWLDRLVYAITFLLGGGMIFLWLMPAILRPGGSLKIWQPLNRRILLESLLVATGLVALVWTLQYALAPTQSANPSTEQSLIQNDLLYFLNFLLIKAILTAGLEEFFYRACLISFLERFRLVESFNLLVNPDRDSTKPGPGHLLLFLPAILFALAHRNHHWYFLIVGLTFSLLYLRGGLGSAMIGHTTHNGLLILASRLQETVAQL